MPTTLYNFFQVNEAIRWAGNWISENAAMIALPNTSSTISNLLVDQNGEMLQGTSIMTKTTIGTSSITRKSTLDKPKNGLEIVL